MLCKQLAANGGEAMEITPMIDIPSLSMAMSQNKVMSDVGVAMLDMSLDNFTEAGDTMTKLMEQSVNPNIGGNIDVSV
jgi:hypothetical protein